MLRDGAGQASNRSDEEVLDLVITNALIIDWSGIYKVDTSSDDLFHGAHDGLGRYWREARSDSRGR